MQPRENKSAPKNRRWARRLVLQALYQWEIGQQELASIEKQFLTDKNIDKADLDYFKALLHGVPENILTMELYLQRYIDRKLSEVDPVELTMLRIATFELLKRQDVPYRVVLNEALELTKRFGATDGHKFVNGILDKIARELRPSEIK